MRFSEVVGQQKMKAILIQAVEKDRIPHAQMFIGGEGSGNLALAMAYVQYISCPDKRDNDSCGVCGSCRKISSMTHPDLHFSFPFVAGTAKVCSELYPQWREAVIENPYMNYEMWIQKIGAQNKQGNIPIEEVRAMIRNLSLRPFEGGFKILVLWLPEFLGNQGNTLLKIIEEPTHKTLFILVAEDLDNILNTIVSRTQILRVPPITNEELSEVLQSKQHLQEADAQRLALLASGNYLKAIELCSNAENEFLDPFRNWMVHCYQRSGNNLAKWVEDTSNTGRENIKSFLLYAIEILRAVVVFPVLGESTGLSEKESVFVANFCKVVNSHTQADKLYELLNASVYEIERNANPKLVLMDLSMKVIQVLKK